MPQVAKPERSALDLRTITIYPKQLRLGDRFTDAQGESEVIRGPWGMAAGKTIHIDVQRPGDAAGTQREVFWAAYEKIAVRREGAGRPGSDDDARGDELRAELRRLRGEVRRLDEEKRGLEERIAVLVQEFEKTPREGSRPRR